MSKLDSLIKEKCPDGVKYLNLEQVCSIDKGVQFNKENMNKSGSYPVINGGINPSGFIEQFNQDENTITISQGGASAGYVNWITTKFWAGAHCYIIKPNELVLNRFLYHFIKSREYSFQECQYGAGIPALNRKTVAETKIPVPPIEVQNEIVQILDNFAELTAELTAELAVELSNRKKQYEYYRDLLLSFDENEYRVKWVTIGDICDVYTGGEAPEGSMKCKLPTGEYSYPIYSNGIGNNAIWGYSKTFRFNQPAITFSSIGTIGHPEIRTEPFTPIIRLKVIIPKSENIDIGYIKYALETADFGLNKSSVPNVNANMIKSIKVCLPDIKKQRQIVNTLNKFDKLVADISEDLPAEIEAREKQYAYYRDKLLSFKELASNA